MRVFLHIFLFLLGIKGFLMAAELKNVENIVQHIQKDIKMLKIEAGFALGLSCLSTVLSVGNTLELAGNYVSMGFGKIMNLVN